MATDAAVDAAMDELIRIGHAEKRINPETGVEEYRITEAGMRFMRLANQILLSTDEEPQP